MIARPTTACAAVLAFLAASAALPACSSSSSPGSAGSIDGGRDSSCPDKAPAPGAICSVAPTLVCGGYDTTAVADSPCGGGGASTSFECEGGRWAQLPSADARGASGASSAEPACPATVPGDGDACNGGCGGASQVCAYDCAHGGGYNATATCTSGAWQVRTFETACEPPDAGSRDGAPGDAGDGGG